MEAAAARHWTLRPDDIPRRDHYFAFRDHNNCQRTLDAILARDPNGRVACETTVATGLVHVMGEISTECYVDIPKIVRDVVRDIG
ncbi:MAG: hypothetical protein ILO10_06740, partial [Kiritimatiellae bacterium]|nr:hypothetical protein [Kiritimatiellia bacterium]